MGGFGRVCEGGGVRGVVGDSVYSSVLMCDPQFENRLKKMSSKKKSVYSLQELITSNPCGETH